VLFDRICRDNAPVAALTAPNPPAPLEQVNTPETEVVGEGADAPGPRWSTGVGRPTPSGRRRD
jgi:hypothetical protein